MRHLGIYASLLLLSLSTLTKDMSLFAKDYDGLAEEVRQSLMRIREVSEKPTSRSELKTAFRSALDLYFKIPDEALLNNTERKRLLETLSEGIGKAFNTITSPYVDVPTQSRSAYRQNFGTRLQQGLSWFWNQLTRDFVNLPRSLPLVGRDARVSARIRLIPHLMMEALARNLDYQSDGKLDTAASANEVDASKLLVQGLKFSEPMRFGWVNISVWMLWTLFATYCFFDPPFELALERTTWSPLIAGALPWAGFFALLARSRSANSGLRFYKEMIVLAHEMERVLSGKKPYGSARRWMMRHLPSSCVLGLRLLSRKSLIPELLKPSISKL